MASRFTSMMLIFLLIMAGSGFAQEPEKCNCTDIMRFVQQKVETVYAGFPNKVSAADKKGYDKMLKGLIKQSAAIHSIDSCYLLTRKYTAFFNDLHLRTQYNWEYVRQHRERTDSLKKILYKGTTTAARIRNTTAFKQLDDNTVLLILPSFEQNYKPIIDSLVKANEALLKAIPHLIVDLRGNDGGYDMTYASLLPFIYNNPYVVYYREVRVSPESIELSKEAMNNQELNKETREFFGRTVKILEERKTGFVNLAGKCVDTIRIEQFFPHPDRVSIITDRGTASSAENFVSMARQCKRVTVFGDNTAGIVDYGDVVWLNPPGFPFVELVIPTQRSCRLSELTIDNVGFAPDVRIPADVEAYKYILDRVKKESH
ncbi:S41 family peptidase [Chitinophaga pinensis]|uniref:Peptidase S41 n=1 Tax=Chitinophaga pinensis (strain ATCC 43595 / DSM 2588 / LMG 13176 / NBRC 15968 / NCIMB 11800 / UQM 2034) TaxID=485918 RepID=A0A979G6L3_CHIPD|nr:S41 family peptidase [Chitinophaga pinensis]ACU61752.1 peptidase S41 [Chitinophaga pinensis DSM 2588]